VTLLTTDRHADGRHYSIVDILKAGGYSTAVTAVGPKFAVETDAPASFALSAAKTIGVRGASA